MCGRIKCDFWQFETAQCHPNAKSGPCLGKTQPNWINSWTRCCHTSSMSLLLNYQNFPWYVFNSRIRFVMSRKLVTWRPGIIFTLQLAFGEHFSGFVIFIESTVFAYMLCSLEQLACRILLFMSKVRRGFNQCMIDGFCVPACGQEQWEPNNEIIDLKRPLAWRPWYSLKLLMRSKPIILSHSWYCCR